MELKTDNPEGCICRITLFGEFGVYLNGIQLPRFKTQKTTLLLAYLACYPRIHSREELMELLWPEVDPQAARNRLSTALSALRHQLEPEGIPVGTFLKADRFTVGLNSASLNTDIAEFESLLNSSRSAVSIAEKIQLFTSALEIYTPSLLTSLYSPWISGLQEHLSELYFEGSSQLLAMLEGENELKKALEVARRSIQIDPLREESYRDMMRLLDNQGRSADALRLYKDFEKRLQEEMEISPSVETQAAAGMIRDRAPNIKTVNALPAPNGLSTSAPTCEIPEIDKEPLFLVDSTALPSSNKKRRSIFAIVGLATIGILSVIFSQYTRPHKALHSATTHLRPPVLAVKLPGAERSHSLPSLATQPIDPIAFPFDWDSVTESNLTPNNSQATQSKPSPAPEGKELWVRHYVAQQDEKDSEATGMTTDPAGNIYLSGFVQTEKNDTDFLTLKYGNDGSLLWHKRYNGIANDSDRARSIAVDKNGNVYVTGESYGGDREKGQTQWDFATVKYDPNGTEQWVRRFNGPPNKDDYAVGVGVDAVGNIYVTGTSRAPDKTASYILIKYSPTGQTLWTQNCNPNSSSPYAADGVIHSFVVGENGDTYSASETILTDSYGKHDIDFLTSRYDHNGNLIWQRRYSGDANGNDKGLRIALDNTGNVYVAGISFLGKEKNSSGEHTLLVKYDHNGNEVWSRTYRNPITPPYLDGLAISRDGSIYIAGVLGDPPQSEVLLKFTASGEMEWAEHFRQSKNPAVRLHSLQIGSNGGIYLTSRNTGSRVESGVQNGEYITTRINEAGNTVWRRNYHALLPVPSNSLSLQLDSRDNVFVTGQVIENSHNTIALIKYSP